MSSYELSSRSLRQNVWPKKHGGIGIWIRPLILLMRCIGHKYQECLCVAKATPVSFPSSADKAPIGRSSIDGYGIRILAASIWPSGNSQTIYMMHAKRIAPRNRRRCPRGSDVHLVLELNVRIFHRQSFQGISGAFFRTPQIPELCVPTSEPPRWWFRCRPLDLQLNRHWP